jgi:hypothetical protein
MAIVNNEYGDHDDNDKLFDLINVIFQFQPKNLVVSSKLSFY